MERKPAAEKPSEAEPRSGRGSEDLCVTVERLGPLGTHTHALSSLHMRFGGGQGALTILSFEMCNQVLEA